MDHSLPGSSVHGIFQARILEWVAISFSNRAIYHTGKSTEAEGLRKRKKEGSPAKRWEREMHSKSIWGLVINRGINKYPIVNVRPFKNLLNAPANWWTHYQQKSPENQEEYCCLNKPKSKLKMNVPGFLWWVPPNAWGKTCSYLPHNLSSMFIHAHTLHISLLSRLES